MNFLGDKNSEFLSLELWLQNLKLFWQTNLLVLWILAQEKLFWSLAKIDAEGNGAAVTIADGKIASTADVDKMSFTFAVVDGGFTIKATNGSYMGSTANSNELKTSTSTKYVNVVAFQTAGDVHIKGTAGTVLRYNNAATNGTRFRYYKSTSYTSQQPIHLYKLVE